MPTEEELEALRAMPVHFTVGGLLPAGAPDAKCLAALAGRGWIVLLGRDSSSARWSLSVTGVAILEGRPVPKHRF